MDALEIAAGGFPHDALDRLGIALKIPLHIAQELDAGIHRARVHRQAVDLLGQGLHICLAAADLHARPLEGVLIAGAFFVQFFKALVQLPELGLGLVDVFAHLAHTVFLLGDVGQHALQALLGALPVGSQNSGEGFALRGFPLGCGQALTRLVGLDILAAHALPDPL